MRIIVRCPNCKSAVHAIAKKTPSGGTVYYCPCCAAELD